MLQKNIKTLTSSIIKKTPYNFDILWNKGPYLLIEMKPKYPKNTNIINNYNLQHVQQYISYDPCTFGKINK